MKTEKHIILLLLVTSAFIGCQIYKNVSVETDPEFKFSNQRTFAWLPDVIDTTNLPYNHRIVRNNLRNYFGKELSKKDFTVRLDTPDVLLQITIINNPKILTIVHPPFPYNYLYTKYYYKSDYYSPYPSDYFYNNRNIICDQIGYCTEKVNYIEGSITLKVIDRKGCKVVWSCTAKGDIYDPAFINRSIHPAVKNIMKKFPAKAIDRHPADKSPYGKNSIITNS